MNIRHFKTLNSLSKDELLALIQRASELKKLHYNNAVQPILRGKVLAMIFEKASTRTRVSFEAGMAQLGGSAIFLTAEHTQMGRGEPISDTAKVLSSMVDAVMIRTYSQDDLNTFAKHSTVPVINALTDSFHPCQLLADIQTFVECKGDISSAKVAWVGDGNNMCNSYINAANILGFELGIATPQNYQPSAKIMANAASNVKLYDNAFDAVKNADLISTDVWSSMGQESESDLKAKHFADFQVNAKLMQHAADDAIFMHCLPAHRGEEVTAQVIDGASSFVWQQAENRLHAQKALLEFLINQV